MELTDSVMCRRLISVSSLHGSKEDALSAQGPARPAQHATGSQPRCPYASFLCFSLVLASEILLWRFLSRIFCSSFFSLEEPVGEQAGSTAGQGCVCVCLCICVCVCLCVSLPTSWHQGVLPLSAHEIPAFTSRLSPSVSSTESCEHPGQPP